MDSLSLNSDVLVYSNPTVTGALKALQTQADKDSVKVTKLQKSHRVARGTVLVHQHHLINLTDKGKSF